MPQRMRAVLACRADAIGVPHAAAAIKKTTIYKAWFYPRTFIAHAHDHVNVHARGLVVAASYARWIIQIPHENRGGALDTIPRPAVQTAYKCHLQMHPNARPPVP